MASLARCSAAERRARMSAVGNRGMARLAGHATLARAPATEPKPSRRVSEFAREIMEELDDDGSKKKILSNLLNAMKLGEIKAFVSILKNTKHDFYGDYFIFMASWINDNFSSKSTVGLFKLMADRGVDIVKLMGTYSLDPLAKVAAFKSLIEEFREMVEAGDISEADAAKVGSAINDAEFALRSIEGGFTKPAQPKLMGAAAAAWTAVGVLFADDVTVLGIADDVAIPFVVVGAVVLSIGAAFSGPKRQILEYGPAIAAVTTAVRQMTDLTKLVKAMETAKGNVADTGVMGLVDAMIAAATGLTVCAALQILLDNARRAKDKAQIKKIISTQKAKKCRHSRAE